MLKLMEKINNQLDTIAASATPPGRGGIAIIRVSGPLVSTVMASMLGGQLQARQAAYRSFLDNDGNILDEGVAIFFPHPFSFTGEDVLELHGHGGPVVVDLLLQHLLHLGVRLARPGEFSERAFLNGKMDLTQAEAIADLIDASSTHAARLALRSLQGEFSKVIDELKNKIIQLRGYIEAAIDFSDQEIDFLSDKKLHMALQEVLSSLKQIQSNAQQGSLLREGITAVIVGEPNVGKSSLLNLLSGKETAIVTNIPGTTRDLLRDDILIDGMPLHIIDTAGLRESEDLVEVEGMKRAYQEMRQADMILYVCDNRSALSASIDIPSLHLSFSPTDTTMIYILNKIDLTQEQPSIAIENGRTIISLSAKTGAGINLLKQHIQSKAGFKNNAEGIFLARRRHLDALTQVGLHLKEANEQFTKNHLEIGAEELRLAQLALSTITGEFSADDLLGHIFSTFCIGK